MKSILLVGQSNMAGRGFIQDVPGLRHERGGNRVPFS